MDPYELCCLPLPGPGLMELGYGMFVNSPLLSYLPYQAYLQVLFLYLTNQIVDDTVIHSPLLYLHTYTKDPSVHEREVYGTQSSHTLCIHHYLLLPSLRLSVGKD